MVTAYVSQELAPADGGDDSNLVAWLEEQKLISQDDVYLTNSKNDMISYGTKPWMLINNFLP